MATTNSTAKGPAAADDPTMPLQMDQNESAGMAPAANRTPAESTPTVEASDEGAQTHKIAVSNATKPPKTDVMPHEVAPEPQEVQPEAQEVKPEPQEVKPEPHPQPVHQDQQEKNEPHVQKAEATHANLPAGVAFVEAAITPLDYELNKRFWAWRPNDIINFTDNVNNSQLGVLEVTRRTVVLLAERISRTGSTDAFNPHLENAMNWLMVKADRYWFPAPESKYKESIKELETYKESLIKGRASFYTRTDNIIPLLLSYEDLLGSCDENLVKQKNDEGSTISVFKADDYFFYAKGVASAMATILEAVHHDFLETLESRHGTELLHHAIESCRQAAALDPLLIINSDLDGVFANHRANMAAPISHARFYISQLIKTLST